MNIYFAHSNKVDFEQEYYKPIDNFFKDKKDFNFILPERNIQNSKETIKNADIFFVEISHPGIGLGIEIGWAESFGKPIYCFAKDSAYISNSIKFVTKNIFTYKNTNEMLEKMQQILNSYNKD